MIIIIIIDKISSCTSKSHLLHAIESKSSYSNIFYGSYCNIFYVLKAKSKNVENN